MENFHTPLKLQKRIKSIVQIPPSPQMKKIGCGTGVAVYELLRSPLADKVRSPWAVKKITQRFKIQDMAKFVNNRVQIEADILRKLEHPNIVGFRAFTKEKDGTNVLAMEECTSSLGDLIECRLDYLGNVPFPPATILKVSHEISNALDYLHNEMLLLHCDIKSYNVLVKGEFEICKLCDFGVCLPVTKSGELDLSKANDEVEYTGTICWCPPEILQSNQEITTKADIYSFGLVIWEMLSLSPPIYDDDDDDVLKNDESFSDKSLSDSSITESKSNRQRPDLPDVELGPEYNLILEMYFCCTAFEKDKRPNAHDLASSLDEVLKNK